MYLTNFTHHYLRCLDDIPFRLLFAKISQDFDFAKHITDGIYKE